MAFWQPYIVAIVVGLLVGIEREKSQARPKTMGVRTFLLISLCGALAGGLDDPWLAGLLAFFALALITLSYFNETRTARDHGQGLTTEFAAGIIFCLGYVAHDKPEITALLGATVAVVLFSKRSLHHFTRSVQPAELETALLLLLGGLLVVNFTPNRTIDPWDIFNPRKFGYLVLALATLEFSSYVLTKIVGEKKGALVVGFLGGLVSSTAVLISSARHAAQEPRSTRLHLTSTLAATMASLVELLVIVAATSNGLLRNVTPAVGVAIVTVGLTLSIIAVKNHKHSTPALTLRSPLDWRGVMRLSLFLGAILAVISFAKAQLGDTGTYALSFLTGLFELHGVTLATATMHASERLSSNVAELSILLAVGASFISKMALAWLVNRGLFSKILTAVFVLTGTIVWLAETLTR